MSRRGAILLALLVPLVPAQAYELRIAEGTNALVLPAGQAVNGEALWFATRVEFQGRARRDAWLLAANAVDFRGVAEGDLRVLAGSAVLGGTARENLLAYARGLQLTTTAVVRGEAALVGETVICEGEVGSNAWIFARAATLGGRWGGNVRVHASELRIVPGTIIAGDLVYTAPKAVVLDDSVAVAGAVKQLTPVLPETQTRTRFVLHGYLFLAALLVGMPFVGFFPVLAGDAVRRLRTSPWRVLAAGSATLLLGPFLVAFAFMTLVGIPLALLLGALIAGLAYLAHIIIALWLGNLLLRAPGPQSFARVLSALAAGLFILYFAGAFPAVAAFLLPPVLVLGTGALVLALLFRPLFPFPLRPPPLPPSSQTPSNP